MAQKVKIDLSLAKGKTSIENVLIAIFLFLAANIIAFGYINYRSYEGHYRRDIELQLAAIADLKSDEISGYLEERLGDGGMLFKRDTFYYAVRRFFEDPEDKKNEEYLRKWLARYGTHYQYANAIILDTNGVVRISVPQAEGKTCSSILKRIPEVLRARQVELGDFCRSEYDNRVYLSVVVPILGEDAGSPPIGVLVLRIDPETHLYPFIEKWPIPSQTAETLLVRRDGEDVLFLNELRFQKNTALDLRFSIDKNADLPAAKAALGNTGIMEGRDYRGVPVVAYVRAVPNSPWFIVARLDVSEAYAPMRRQLWYMAVFYIALIVVVGTALWFVWRRQSLIFYRAQYIGGEALGESEERYRMLFEAAKDGVLIVDFDTGIILDVNPFLTKLLGYSKSDLLKKYLWDVGIFKNIAASKDSFLELQAKGYIRYEDLPLETRSGTDVEVEFVSNVYYSAGKKTIQYNIRDITERRHMEMELHLRGEIVKNMAEGVYIVGADDGIIKYCNPKFENMFGYDPGEMIGKHVSIVNAFVDKDPKETAKEIMDTIEKTGEWRGEVNNVKKDGTVLCCYASCSLFHHPVYGRVIVAVHNDITERRHAEEALGESESKFKTLFNDSRDGIILADIESKQFIMCNKSVCKMLGYTEGEMIRLSVNDIHPAEDLPRIIETFESQARGEIRLAVDLPVKRKDGTVFYAEVNTTLIILKGKRYLMGSFRDVSERKRAEEMLRSSEDSYRAIFESANDAIIIRDINTYEITNANNRAYEMFCYPPGEMTGLGLEAVSVKSAQYSIEKLRQNFKNAADDRPQVFEWHALDKFARGFWVEINVRRAVIGGKYRLLSVVRDITERKQLLEQKDSFVNMVSHELRTPLGAIKEAVALVSEGRVGPLGEKQKDVIEVAKRNVDRLARLIDDVLDLQRIDAGRMELRLKENDLNEAIKEVYRTMISLAAKKGLVFTVKLDENIPLIKFDRDKIAEVLINLVNNAIKFTEKGGIVITSSRGQNFIQVSVADTGPGVKEEDMPKLFQRFAQLTRSPGGTGLGLAISKEIIEAHRGKIGAESEFGKGATFHFILPIKERRV